METKNIIIIIVIILLLYVVIRYVMADVNTLSGLMSGTTMQTIESTSLAKDNSDLYRTNFAYSIWYNIDDWNFKYGDTKVLFGRMSSLGDTVETSGPCPEIVFTPVENNMIIYLTVTSGTKTGTCKNAATATKCTTYGCCIDGTTCATGANGMGCPISTTKVESCTIQNIPIQKWTNVVISVYGRSLDVYIDGKLVKTQILSNTVTVKEDANVYITPSGGFSGWTSNFGYFPKSLNPQEVWNIYQNGYGASWLANLFGRYNVKISFLENGTEDSSFTI